jgi:hypothetical protein
VHLLDHANDIAQLVLLAVPKLANALEVVLDLRDAVVVALSFCSAGLVTAIPARDTTTHWVDLGRVLKHDLVLVVDVAELLLGDVDAGARDKVHLDTVRPEPTCKESANGPLTLPSWRSS